METTGNDTRKPKRHGCLVAYLAFSIFASFWTGLIYFFGRDTLVDTYPDAPPVLFSVLAALTVLNIALCVAIIKWKRIGFYGMVAVALIVIPVNYAVGLSIPVILFGLTGVIILYVVLQLGGDDRAWDYLE